MSVPKDTKAVPDIIARLLKRRGMSEAEITSFLYPDYENHLHDPYLLLDMDRAVDRIEHAMANKERIAIYGDYDIDGITASAVMLEMMSHLGIEAESYIPDRFEEGYGINQAALEILQQRGFDLIISVDCGITSVKEAKWAKENNLDLIITDHHAVPETLPDAVAVINPKRPGDPYPFKDLAGVGVAFKLVQALQQRLGRPAKGAEKWLLDLVALGTVCDVVTLVGENRVLASYGLRVMTKTRRVGLRALTAVGRATIEDITSYHLGFVLGPRMNAAGRLEHAARSLELMLTGDGSRALAIAEELDTLNTQRKSDQKRIFAEADAQAELYADDPVLIVSGKDWSHGVVGIVASKLVEKWQKPVLVAQELGEKTKGSARSVPGFDIVSALKSREELFTKVGGHYFAAGYTLPTNKIDELRTALNSYAKINPPDPFSDDLQTEIDLESLSGVDWGLLDDLSRLEPFGAGNQRPLIKIGKVILADSLAMGKERTHLRITVKDDNGNMLTAVGFGMASVYGDIPKGSQIEIIGYLSKNEYNGSSSIQLMVEKINYDIA